MIQELTARLDQLEAKVEQVEGWRKVSDAKVQALESKLRSSDARAEEFKANLKESEAQLALFKTRDASDEKEQLKNDLGKTKCGVKLQDKYRSKQLESKLRSSDARTDEEFKTILKATEAQLALFKMSLDASEEKVKQLENDLEKIKVEVKIKDKHVLHKTVKNLRASGDRMRKQMVLSCSEMEQVRRKFMSPRFKHRLTSKQKFQGKQHYVCTTCAFVLLFKTNVPNLVLLDNLFSVNNDLWEAAKDGNVEKIRDALDNGADINCKLEKENTFRSTPLIVASSHGHVFAAEYLILRGSDTKMTNDNGGGPIHMASANDRVNVMSLLLEYGVDINQANMENGGTPLHYASAHGHPASVRFLMENGADTSVRDTFGNFSAFDLAGFHNKNQKEAVQKLFHDFVGDNLLVPLKR